VVLFGQLGMPGMPGGGHVEVGVSSPCPGIAEKQTAIVRGVAMPASRPKVTKQ
jgi:hypothetical protein